VSLGQLGLTYVQSVLEFLDLGPGLSRFGLGAEHPVGGVQGSFPLGSELSPEPGHLGLAPFSPLVVGRVTEQVVW